MCLQRIDAKVLPYNSTKPDRNAPGRVGPRSRTGMIALGIGEGRRPIEVHAGDCYTIGKRRRPVSQDEARRLLATGIRARSHSTPDTTLDIPLPSSPAPATASC
ncbi:DUF6233 domain-containing protein [Streptomyces sp. NPDC002701]|uniref:DUF6233 domain-containing protein n=1 Tax=Streptomyces sp. NPDC002701 TaxID=3364661 RepID=UPI0036AF66F8